MADSFATIADLEARYKPLTDQADKARILLEDATQLIKDLVPSWETSSSPETRRRITCDMVRRALSAEGILGDGLSGVSQTSETAGGFSQSYTFSNPTGDLYLTRQEKRILRGKASVTAYTIDVGGEARAAR